MTSFKTQILELRQFLDALDAIKAAVNGADMNDISQRRDIMYWLDDLYCKLGDVIDGMEVNKPEGERGETTNGASA